LALGLLVMLLLAAGGAWGGLRGLQRWAGRPYGPAAAHKLHIAPGLRTRAIGALLKAEGLVSDDRLLLAWLKLRRVPRPIQAGDYEIRTPVTPQTLAEILSHGRFERALTVPEGWTARQIARRLVAEHWIKDERVWLELVARPLAPPAAALELPQGAEGFCFPETYRFENGTKPEEILRRMLARFRHEWEQAEPARREPRSEKLTQRQVVTLASMLEREARTAEEMPEIASVYLNRLERGMKMQCCATVRYALGEVWDRPLTFADLKVDSPYNTYRNPGLPPGPIANPGRAALRAVLRPAPGDFFFYVYAGDNHHVFSRTYAEHMKAVRAVRRKNPQTGEPAQDAQ